jgi:hypothetical protein
LFRIVKKLQISYKLKKKCFFFRMVNKRFLFVCLFEYSFTWLLIKKNVTMQNLWCIDLWKEAHHAARETHHPSGNRLAHMPCHDSLQNVVFKTRLTEYLRWHFCGTKVMNNFWYDEKMNFIITMARAGIKVACDAMSFFFLKKTIEGNNKHCINKVKYSNKISLT